jgi:hypothetical protein
MLKIFEQKKTFFGVVAAAVALTARVKMFCQFKKRFLFLTDKALK